MSLFSHYANRFDEIARTCFVELNEAKNELDRAEKVRRENPQRYGIVSAETAAKIAQAEADYQRARAKWDSVHSDAPSKARRELAALRRELLDSVSAHYAAKPADVDPATLELLKSGICKAGDYARLFADATTPTMKRLIAKAAEDAAAMIPADGNRAEAQAMTAVALIGKEIDGSATLRAFDDLYTIFERIEANPGIANLWAESFEVLSKEF